MLLPPEMEADVDAAWESFNPYDRWSVDSCILNNLDLIRDTTQLDWWALSAEQQETCNLFFARNDEMRDQLHEWDQAYWHARNTRGAVYEEWYKRYFARRTEPVSDEGLEQVLASKYQYATASGRVSWHSDFDDLRLSLLRYRNVTEGSCIHRVLADIEIVKALEAVLIVPPGITVTGDTSGCCIIKWDDIDVQDGLYLSLKKEHNAEITARVSPLDITEQTLRSM